MMISPKMYLDELKDATYSELIAERKALIAFIDEYEEKELAGDRSDEGWQMHPSPQVRYQCYLEYLSLLCSYMQEKYNKEFVWGDEE